MTTIEELQQKKFAKCDNTPKKGANLAKGIIIGIPVILVGMVLMIVIVMASEGQFIMPGGNVPSGWTILLAANCIFFFGLGGWALAHFGKDWLQCKRAKSKLGSATIKASESSMY